MERATLDPKERSLREELVEIQLFSNQNVDHSLAKSMLLLADVSLFYLIGLPQ